MDEAVVAPEEARRLAQGEKRGLDRERPAPAHRVDEAPPSVPAGREDDRGSERLLHRRRERDLPVTPPGEGLAGGVEVEGDPAPPPEDVDDRPVPVGSRVGPNAAFFLHPVDDRVLRLEVDEPGVVDRRGIHRRGDAEVGVLPPFVEDLLPREVPQAAVETFGILRREGRNEEEDPVARPEVEVQGHRVGEGPLRLDGRLPLREDREAKGADLPGKPWGNPLGTGDHDPAFFHPRTHLHFGILTQPRENANKREGGRRFRCRLFKNGRMQGLRNPEERGVL